MTSLQSLHYAQVHILDALRRVKAARFSELQKPTGMTSDAFKFHVRKLMTVDLIVKLPDGRYALTPAGKEYANRLDAVSGKELSSPKSSMLFVVTSASGPELKYLLHERQREPFYGFWGFASGPLARGVSIYETSSNEFSKQTGLDANFEVFGVIRAIDQTPAGATLEDKMFSIMTAEIDDYPSARPWQGGCFEWLTEEQLLQKDPLFANTTDVLLSVRSNQTFTEKTTIYQVNEY